MISVLVVEDDTQKFGQIYTALVAAGVAEGSIEHAITAANGLDKVRRRRFDLMLLDINLPLTVGAPITRGGGVRLLNEILKSKEAWRPKYVIGVTAFQDILSEFGQKFESQLWSLLHYDESSNVWRDKISAKVSYINAVRNSENFSDGITYGVDLALVCALDTVEMDAVKALPCDWQPLRLAHDDTRYLTGSIRGETRSSSVIAAAAPRMGMPASAALASKMIFQFRPRNIVMVGICAGRIGKANLGDIIVANPSWDYGSGKIETENGAPKFSASPHHIELDEELAPYFLDAKDDAGMLAAIKKSFLGPKPESELNVHIGPMASGAAVVANPDIFRSVVNQHRNLVGLEMEAYGVLSAVRSCGRPRAAACAVKSVCDFADEHKGDEFQAYAAHTSARFVYEAALRFL